MKILALLLLFLAASPIIALANNGDSTKRTRQQHVDITDSLKQQLKDLDNDSAKTVVYAQLAAQYLKYDTISNKQTQLRFQNEALNYTMLALHYYAHYNDTLGMRTCFNNLAQVYRSQKKYSQAKWFILQSNTLSRAKNDVPNIVSSLNDLAYIKMAIKDYQLAMGDLNEALKLSTKNHLPEAEMNVQQNYAFLYSYLGNYKKEAIATKRYNVIKDSLHKVELTKLLAENNAREAAETKKKSIPIVYRKFYKSSLAKRTASL